MGSLAEKRRGLGLLRQVSKGVVSESGGNPGRQEGGFPEPPRKGAGCRLPSCLRAVEGSMGPSAVLSQEPERVGRVLTQLSRFQGTGTRSGSSLFWRINFS